MTKLLKVRALPAIGAQNPTLALLILLALWAGYRPAVAQPFTQVIVFGDSNVDSGYYKALSSPGGSSTYNALWPSAVAHGAGAPTTNPDPGKAQMLAAYFGLTANPSNTASGTNYATSGAKNVTVNNSQTGGFGAAIPTVTQISNYLAANSGAADSQALYLIYSGDNDIKYALGQSGAGPYPPDPNAYMTTAADDLATAIQSLNTAGAKSIIVSGLAYDYPTGSANATERALKLLYTNTLWNQLTTLSVPFHRGDIDSVRLAISANPSKYGFTSINTTTVACTQPSGVSTAWALLCSSDPAAPSTWVSPTAPQTDLFADDQHLATAGQRLMARYFRNLVLPPTATHDYNGDGKSDIIWRDTTGGPTSAWIMNGAQVLSSGGLGTVPNTWSIVGQRDFDGDGKYDLLWRDTSGNTAMWFLNGATVSSTGSLGNIPTNWTVVATADFDGDGKGDILWQDTSGNLAIWLMNGATVALSGGLGNVPPVWTIVGTGDFNNDGKADLLWRDNSGNTAIWFMNGAAVSSTGSLGNIPTVWSVVGTGDFNGDGYSDILWEDTSGNVAMWLMNGATVSSSGGLGNVPTVWSVVATGDYDGDGKSDLLWRDTGGNTAMWFMNGTAVASSASLGNIATNWTVQSVNAE